MNQISDMNMIIGVFAIVAAGYCFYAYYKLKYKNEITKSLMLSDNMTFKKCIDYPAYCAALQFPLLLLAVMCLILGCIDIYNARVGGAELLGMIAVAAMLICLMYYNVCLKKANEKYFC